MVVQHNLTAMNSNRMLGITTGQQAKSSEKLASGFQINRAADDAAGLSISEKMRKQMRGLDRASTNAQDGVSAVQTAEGALTEVHSMLQRINELAVQAANGTNSVDDRNAIQAEVEQLTTEINRVADATKFNEAYLLKGGVDVKTVNINAHDAGLKGTLVQGSGDTSTFTIELKAGETVSIAGVDYRLYDDSNELTEVEADITAFAADANNGKSVIIDGTTYTYKTDADGNGTKAFVDASNKLYTAADLNAIIEDGTTVKLDTGNILQVVDSSKDDARSITAAQALVKAALIEASSIGGSKSTAVIENDPTDNNDGTFTYTIKKATVDVQEDLTFSLHVGADADMTNKIGVSIAVMDAAGLGIQGLNVADETGIAATYAIDAIADAVAKVSAQRSALGAIQNRLEHTIANLDNVVENTTAAESRIRDTDMASEMVEYSKNNILAQAGQSMLAQANQATQGVLSLLG